MSILTNTDWDAIDCSFPVLAKGTVRVKVGDVKEVQEERDGGIKVASLHVPLTLLSEATNLEGKPVMPGFGWTDRIGIMSSSNGAPLTEGQQKANEISAAIQKEFLCAVLGVSREAAGISEAAKALNEKGGWPTVAGKEVIASIDVRTDKNDETRKFQTVKHYSAVPSGS